MPKTARSTHGSYFSLSSACNNSKVLLLTVRSGMDESQSRGHPLELGRALDHEFMTNSEADLGALPYSSTLKALLSCAPLLIRSNRPVARARPRMTKDWCHSVNELNSKPGLLMIDNLLSLSTYTVLKHTFGHDRKELLANHLQDFVRKAE